jgi:hypothetical protein
MGRTAIPVSKYLGQDIMSLYRTRGVLMTSAAATFDQTNGHSIAMGSGRFPLDMPIYLIVANTDTADHVITLAKGASATYAGALDLGDVTFTVPASGTYTYGPVSLPRHAQDGAGTLYVDGDASTAGTITCEIRRA